METDALIRAFGRLPTSDARLRAMEALMRTLSPYEWRAVHSVAAARRFEVDIIGRLPVELVAQIFAYLDTSAPYRLQPVSRQWCHKLRSSAVLTKSLLSWQSTLDQDSADYRLLEHKAKAIHAYRHGKPKHGHYFKVVTPIPDNMILMADTLIYGTPPSDPRAVNLFHIKTWKMHNLNGNARERIHRLFASDQIVGFTTLSNVCYVSDHQGCGKRKFRVPNAALFQSLACRERTVACAGVLTDHVLVYIWNYDSQQGSSFTVPFNTFPPAYAKSLFVHGQGLALLLHPKDERITIFADERSGHLEHELACYEWSDEEFIKSHVWYCQLTYTGDCVFKAEHCFYGSERAITTFEHLNNPFIPVDDFGNFKICIGDGVDPVNARWLQYDERLKKFTDPTPIAGSERARAALNLGWWNDTIFSFLEDSGDLEVLDSNMLAHLGTSETRGHKALIYHKWDPSLREQLNRDSLLLNGKYVIRACAKHFYLLCFEESAHYPKADVEFFGMGSVMLMDAEKLVIDM